MFVFIHSKLPQSQRLILPLLPQIYNRTLSLMLKLDCDIIIDEFDGSIQVCFLPEELSC
jgi:hypothetical protein